MEQKQEIGGGGMLPLSRQDTEAAQTPGVAVGVVRSRWILELIGFVDGLDGAGR